jgi:Zn-dependent peptidase ImmA (M78 family)
MNTKPTTRKSLLRNLRALVPNRPLSASGAYSVTERQAAALRRELGITSPEFPEEAVSLVPRVRVLEIDNLPTSGVSKWHKGQWVIAVNGREPWQRQRFTVAHELGHFIASTTEDRLLAHANDRAVRREQLADYFAGCLLMPTVHLRRLVAQGYGIEDLADLFGVSVRAVEVRLNQVTIRPRCDRRAAANGLLKDWKYVCPPPGAEGVAA